LRRYLGLARRLGPREKRAVSRVVFIYFRWLEWLDQRQSLQKQLAHAADLHDRFTRDPKSIKPETLAARAVPAWLREEMELPTAYLQQLQREPALWLRARPGTAATLAQTLGHCEPAPVAGSEFRVPGWEPTPNSDLPTPISDLRAPDALRYTGQQDLFLTPAFHAGAFEIQDLASQLVGVTAAPQPRQTWWDACAGEGGKTLHLADLMDNKGLIWATDRNPRRLETLKRRAARAHLFNFRTALWEGGPKLPTKTKFDGILVDAPCSGVGTWQRNPHARWTTTLDDVHELAATQLALLNHVAPSLKSGGRLIYAACTLTRSETTAVADAFTSAHAADFERVSTQTLWPQDLNANGMFIAVWTKR
jgi:16S rRNA (cytosine967-C5)-methyltransferase